MQLKNPGGDLWWYTPLMAAGGLFVGYSSWTEGHPIMAALFGAVGVLSMLVWFDQKWVAFPLIGFFGFAVVAGIVLLFIQGFTISRLCKTAMAGYFVADLIRWAKQEDEPPPLDLEPPDWRDR